MAKVQTGGVVSKRVIFQSVAFFIAPSFFASHESASNTPGAYTCSKRKGILLMFTPEFTWDAIVIAKVAFNAGSSQHGKAFLAAVG